MIWGLDKRENHPSIKTPKLNSNDQVDRVSDYLVFSPSSVPNTPASTAIGTPATLNGSTPVYHGNNRYGPSPISVNSYGGPRRAGYPRPPPPKRVLDRFDGGYHPKNISFTRKGKENAEMGAPANLKNPIETPGGFTVYRYVDASNAGLSLSSNPSSVTAPSQWKEFMPGPSSSSSAGALQPAVDIVAPKNKAIAIFPPASHPQQPPPILMNQFSNPNTLPRPTPENHNLPQAPVMTYNLPRPQPTTPFAHNDSPRTSYDLSPASAMHHNRPDLGPALSSTPQNTLKESNKALLASLASAPPPQIFAIRKAAPPQPAPSPVARPKLRDLLDAQHVSSVKLETSGSAATPIDFNQNPLVSPSLPILPSNDWAAPLRHMWVEKVLELSITTGLDPLFLVNQLGGGVLGLASNYAPVDTSGGRPSVGSLFNASSPEDNLLGPSPYQRSVPAAPVFALSAPASSSHPVPLFPPGITIHQQGPSSIPQSKIGSTPSPASHSSGLRAAQESTKSKLGARSSNATEDNSERFKTVGANDVPGSTTLGNPRSIPIARLRRKLTTVAETDELSASPILAPAISVVNDLDIDTPNTTVPSRLVAKENLVVPSAQSLSYAGKLKSSAYGEGNHETGPRSSLEVRKKRLMNSSGAGAGDGMKSRMSVRFDESAGPPRSTGRRLPSSFPIAGSDVSSGFKSRRRTQPLKTPAPSQGQEN